MPYAVWHGLAADESSSDLVVLASPSVTVTDRTDGSKASLFADRAGNTALANPFTANADGSITFYAPPGRYKIEATDGANTATWGNVLIGVPHGMDSRTDQAVPKYVSANNQFEPVLVGTAATSIPTNAEIGAYVPAITDGGTDAYTVSAGRAIGTDETFTGDVGSANTTTTPTLDNTDGADGALTVTTRDGSALWAGALSGVHKFKKAASSWLVLDPNPSQQVDPIAYADDVPRVRAVGVLARHQNLSIANNATNPAFQVDIAADEVEVYDSANAPRVLTSVSLTADITVSGANGLDTGTEAASTWYHIWVIYDGTAAASLLSTSSTFSGLTLPTGYTYAGYAGAALNNGSSNFDSIEQSNARVTFVEATDLSGGTATSYTAVSLKVPPTASMWHGTVSTTGGNASGDSDVRIASTPAPLGRKRFLYRNGSDTGAAHVPADLPLVESATLYYRNDAGDGATIVTTGWEF